jgi:hypothetical protein
MKKTLDQKDMDNIAGLVQEICQQCSAGEEKLDQMKIISAHNSFIAISKKAEMIFLRTRP